MALVGRYCIDRYEAHLVRVDASGSEHPQSPYVRPDSGVRYAARSLRGMVPQAYVNRREAADACGAAGKRLCTLREWYQACTNGRRTTYPYGDQAITGHCNTNKAHVLSQLFGSDPRQWKYEEHFNSPKLNREPGFLAPSGQYANCATQAGVYDMVGNLHEWVSDRVDHDLPSKVPLREDIREKIDTNYNKAIFMGGFYSTAEQHGRGCSFLTPGHGWKYHDYSTGFRCCRDEQSSSTPGPTLAP